MSKELEALKSIHQTIQQLDYDFVSKEDEEDFILIETALKENQERIEELEETNNLMFIREHKNQKKLKALEIIKKKEVNVEIFNSCPNLYEYNNWATQLTQEEYDLLKEILI